MATKTRKLTVAISGEDKGTGKAFKGVASDADKLGKQLGQAGEKGGKGLRTGVEKETDKLGSKLRGVGSNAGERVTSGFKSGLSGLGNAAESAGSSAADAISSGFDPSAIADSLSGALENVGGRLGPAAGAAGLLIGGAMAVGVMNGMETEVTTDRLAAQLGGGDWAEEQGEVAGNLYRDAFGDSLADTADAVRRVVTNILPEGAPEVVEALTEDFLTFTDVMEQDMDMATQAVSNMLRTGIADSGTEALDILTRGVQQGADRAGDLLETFQEYSTEFREIGISAADATGLMTQGLQAGARDADTVADALKEFAIRGQDATEASAEGFEKIGLNAEEMTAKVAAGGPEARAALDQVLDGLQGMEDPLERNLAAVALFGPKAEDLGDALFSLDLDSAAAGLGIVEGATDKLGSAYDNASTRIETFRRNAMHKLTTFVGNEVIPKLTALSDWAKENPGAFQAIAAVVGGVVVVAFTAWAISAGMAAAATIAATWPVLLVLALVAGAIALVVIHWDTIKDAASAVWNWISDNWPKLLAVITGPIGIAAAFVIHHWDTIKRWVGNVIDFITTGVGKVKDWIVDRFRSAKNFVVGAWQSIWDKASSVKNRIVFAVVNLKDRVIGAFNRARDMVRGAWQSIWDKVDWVKGKIGGAVDWIKEKVAAIPGAISDAISSIPGGGLVRRGLSAVGLNFDTGGVVPGPVGAPRLAVVHGGETVVPTHDPSAMGRLTNDDFLDFRSGETAATAAIRSVGADFAAAAFEAQRRQVRADTVHFHWLARQFDDEIENLSSAQKERHVDLRQNLWILLRGMVTPNTFSATRFARGLPQFADGGTVPGPRGAPRLVMAHGGEEITPPGEGGGGDVYVTIDARGAVGLDEAKLEEVVVHAVNRAVQNGRPIRRPRNW